jgi:hypothetical protein
MKKTLIYTAVILVGIAYNVSLRKSYNQYSELKPKCEQAGGKMATLELFQNADLRCLKIEEINL